MSDDRLERFTEEIGRWSERPPSLTPRQARTRVLAHLPDCRPRPIWRLVAGGAALAATALIVALLVGDRRQPVVGPPAAAPPAAQRTIVHQLSSGTQLYIVVRPDTFTNGT